MKHITESELQDIARRTCIREFGADDFAKLSSSDQEILINTTSSSIELGYALCTVDRRAERRSHLLFVVFLWLGRLMLFTGFYILLDTAMRGDVLDAIVGAGIITLVLSINITKTLHTRKDDLNVQI